ncbi:MAG: glycosyltransferase, partial [Alphaproteobacteria bacterium]
MPDISRRKQRIRDLADRQARERRRWQERNSAFHQADRAYMRFLVPPGLRVLDLGCGIGDLLGSLRPSRGVGVDFSPAMVEMARQNWPGLEFLAGDMEDPATLAALNGPFDVIILADSIGALDDIQGTLAALHPLCTPQTRLIVAYYASHWEPVLRLAEMVGRKMPQEPQNWLSTEDITNLMDLADFEPVKREWRQLVPLHLLGLGRLINRYVATLPLIRHLCLRNYVVGRPRRETAPAPRSATVVVPLRNERGNVAPAIERLPAFCPDIEVIFVEGHSQDGTFEEAERVVAAHPERDIKLMRQDGKGKADAVFKAFDAARGEVLMILDGDLTMPPEQLPKFWQAMAEGKGEFINGSRLVYPLERESMRFLNRLAKQAFSLLFTWLHNQRNTDTLCGTKVLRRSDYERLKAGRAYFGDFDPFGDFDLIFGASKLNLKIVEVPVRYAPRTYGETQISRFAHG